MPFGVCQSEGDKSNTVNDAFGEYRSQVLVACPHPDVQVSTVVEPIRGAGLGAVPSGLLGLESPYSVTPWSC